MSETEPQVRSVCISYKDHIWNERDRDWITLRVVGTLLCNVEFYFLPATT